ncbi:MAG: bifunctional chorismate mutase/prephenate dehydratase [Lachnospiraceae bacterium]|nr:bifunctional chorismate mutase/prephenate dehydratase [Lachnospiraceae bacterium]
MNNNADLAELRHRLDDIDSRIVKLYEERMDICSEVADVKIATGRRVLDRERELAKLKSVRDMTHNEFNAKGIEELFEQIMSMSRKLQYQKLTEQGAIGRLPFIAVDKLDTDGARVVFQGAEGAYSQAATENYFGEEISCFHVDTFRDAFMALDEGSADFAVLPIENSTAGTVSQVYDLLVEFESYIVGETVIRIEHCLMGTQESSIDDIATVYSHPQSLMQSARFLIDHPGWRQISMQNNAFAAQKVRDDNDPTQAAIASERAASAYGLKILEKGVNQDEDNQTRFIIVCNQKIYMRSAGHVALALEVPHSSGSLYHMLSHFIYNDLNMTKIESRPIEDRDWEYRFFIELEGNLAEPSVKNAIRGLREEARMLKVIGCF